MRRLVLKSFQSPGDVVMLTAAVRDLHAAEPGRFLTDVRTSAEALWEHNPLITKLCEGDVGVETLDMHYPLVHQSNQRPYHFLHGYPQYLEERLGVRVPVTKFSGDIPLSADEKSSPPLKGVELPERFWIIVAGGKYDFTAKWWNPDSYQKVVDHFAEDGRTGRPSYEESPAGSRCYGKITFVQCGEAGHWHPRLSGVIDLVGKTTLREFVRLMHHAEGVVCPVTLAMHLAAAVETRPGRSRHRPCVVIAGGREPPQWEAYPQHQYLSTVGMLSCCADGGCWKSRCQLVGDGDLKDRRDVCEQPVQVTPELRIPRCLDMISPEDVIRKIEMYLSGGLIRVNGETKGDEAMNGTVTTNGPANGVEEKPPHPNPLPRRRGRGDKSEEFPSAERRDYGKAPHRVRFQHGLGDCAYFAHLIPLYTRRGYRIEVECTPDKRLLFEAAGAHVLDQRVGSEHAWGYPSGGTHEGHGRFWQGSKIGHNISEPPLPDIGAKGELWDELCASRIDIRPHLSAETLDTARRWLARLPRPVVLLHQKGNTAQERKSLSNSVTEAFYREFLDRCDGTLILLDWDQRVPRLASYRVRHLSDFGPCPLDLLLALMTDADLLIGVDSGPLHLSRFTNIPTIGVWQPGHYPATYTLPRPEQLNVVLADPTRQWNKFKRIPWNIVEQSGPALEAATLAELTGRMLTEPRYLQVPSRGAIPFRGATGEGLRSPVPWGGHEVAEDTGGPKLSPVAHGEEPSGLRRTLALGTGPTQAQDVQLQQFVREFCRCGGTSGLATQWDRQRSLDDLLRETAKRFATPTIVETGTIRAEEDFGGAGFFTYLAGAFVQRHGGRLHSVDLTPQHVAFARDWTAVFGEAVSVHQGDSVSFLTNFPSPIDVLYLDSLDTTEPGHAQHCQRELEAALPRLHDRSLICIDDTPWQTGAFTGKGAIAVPWLLEHGWQILYAGYQVVLTRSPAGGVSTTIDSV